MQPSLPTRRGTYRQDAAPGVQGGLLVPFGFRGVSSSGSSSPRLLPIKTWHSEQLKSMDYFTRLESRRPPRRRTWDGAGHSTGCGIPPAGVQRRHLAHSQLPLSGDGMYKCTDSEGCWAVLCFVPVENPAGR